MYIKIIIFKEILLHNIWIIIINYYFGGTYLFTFILYTLKTNKILYKISILQNVTILYIITYME